MDAGAIGLLIMITALVVNAAIVVRGLFAKWRDNRK